MANEDSPVKVDVAIAFHPSFLVEADLKNINSVPCAILKGSADDMLSDDQLTEARLFPIPILVHLFLNPDYDSERMEEHETDTA